MGPYPKQRQLPCHTRQPVVCDTSNFSMLDSLLTATCQLRSDAHFLVASSGNKHANIDTLHFYGNVFPAWTVLCRPQAAC